MKKLIVILIIILSYNSYADVALIYLKSEIKTEDSTFTGYLLGTSESVTFRNAINYVNISDKFIVDLKNEIPNEYWTNPIFSFYHEIIKYKTISSDDTMNVVYLNLNFKKEIHLDDIISVKILEVIYTWPGISVLSEIKNEDANWLNLESKEIEILKKETETLKLFVHGEYPEEKFIEEIKESCKNIEENSALIKSLREYKLVLISECGE